MTEADRTYYRRRLLQLKKQHGSTLSELEEEILTPAGGEMSGGVSDVPLHPADLGTDTFEQELGIDLMVNEDQILREIEDALERLDRGTFGRCENCHKPIPRERLEVLPYARYCIRCARKLQHERTT